MRKKAMNYVAQVTELSTEKVELSQIDDLKKLNNEYIQAKKAADIAGLQAKADFVAERVERMVTAADKMESIVSNVRKMAEELGVNANDIDELVIAENNISDQNIYKGTLKLIKAFADKI